jgi:DinB superfamily
MHPRLAELLDYAEAQRAGLLAAVAEVPEPLRNQRPDPDSWSVAEVLEHLFRVEQGIARLIRRALERAKAAGLGPEGETETLLGSLDRFRISQRAGRMPSPELVSPKGELTASQAVTALAESRRELRAAALEGDGLALNSILRPHVILGPLTLYQWILFLGQHEARHTLQIQEIGGWLIPGPQSPA